MSVDRTAGIAHPGANVQGAPRCIKQSGLALAVARLRAATQGARRQQATLHIRTNSFACAAGSVASIAEVPQK